MTGFQYWGAEGVLSGGRDYFGHGWFWSALKLIKTVYCMLKSHPVKWACVVLLLITLLWISDNWNGQETQMGRCARGWTGGRSMRYAKRCEKKEQGRVHFWAVNATGATPSKGLSPVEATLEQGHSWVHSGLEVRHSWRDCILWATHAGVAAPWLTLSWGGCRPWQAHTGAQTLPKGLQTVHKALL